jgi:hypothetical protein
MAWPPAAIPCVRSLVTPPDGAAWTAGALADFLPAGGPGMTIEIAGDLLPVSELDRGPGARPTAADWGFASAVRNGIRAELQAQERAEPALAIAVTVRVQVIWVNRAIATAADFEAAGRALVRVAAGREEPVAAQEAGFAPVPAGLSVRARWLPGGELSIEGQHLSRGGEYEYALGVPAAQVPLIAAALGAAPASDLLYLLRARSREIITRGEKTWLGDLGITPRFWARHDD